MLFIDSHVHIHKSFNPNTFFQNVFNNFEKMANEHFNKSQWIGVLCLTEMQGVNFFSKICSEDNFLSAELFTINTTDERISIIVENNKKQRIVIIAGKQIISKEGIEVLALFSDDQFDEKIETSSLIKIINGKKGIPVLPWGVGKWIGNKGKVIKELLGSKLNFYIGDNSGRLKLLPEPSLFKTAINNNHFVLHGTDALPISTQVNKTGKFGFILDIDLDLNKPAEILKKKLLELKKQPTSFGSLECPHTFFRNQILMQVNKYLK